MNSCLLMRQVEIRLLCRENSKMSDFAKLFIHCAQREK